jgi:acyl-coenzyme A synthetase/AMP-(fatty) acid ligase
LRVYAVVVPTTFLCDEDGNKIVCLQDVVPKYPKESAVEWVDAEDTLFLLYTSGSTGKPKVCMFKWRTTTLNSLNTLFWTKS